MASSEVVLMNINSVNPTTTVRQPTARNARRESEVPIRKSTRIRSVAQRSRRLPPRSDGASIFDSYSRDAAIHANVLAGHPASRITRQKSDHFRNFRRLAQPAERRQLRKSLDLFRRFASLEQLSFRRAG